LTLIFFGRKGENVLVPRPAWSYVLWMWGANIKPKFYDLDPNKGWDIDLKQLESQIDDKTRAIVCNSPGNPCGKF
jgi:tyrosine aminotransferase